MNLNLIPAFLLIGCGEIKTQNRTTDTSATAFDTASTDTDVSSGYDIPAFPNGVSTLAGSGAFSSMDGMGTEASFSEPKAIRMRNDGVLIIADSGTGAIRELNLDGTVTTLQLTGPTPTTPSGLAIADDGSLYVSDYAAHCIYKISGNESSVFAGSCGNNGFQDGSAALFDLPRGLDLDANGNLIVADAHNFRIRSIRPDGFVSTLAGTGEEFVGPSEGSVESANIYIPFGVAVHSSGDVYLSGFDNCIRRITDGRVENVAGLCQNYSNTGTDDGAPAEARFDTPLDISFTPEGSLLVADCYNDRIRVLSADQSRVDTVAGTSSGYLDGGIDEAKFDVPRSITTDYAGNIYVADSVNMRIRVIRKD